jgi:uncharacterized caspase-like protein
MEPGPNRIEVIATNSYSLSPETVETFYESSQPYRPNLWILAVGVNNYNSPDLRDLKYAVNDAREIVNFFKTQEGKAYNKVNSLLISDEEEKKPTAGNIINSLYDFLGNATDEDVILLFLAGHGIKDARNNFFFCSSDTVINDDGSIQRYNAIPASEIINIKNLPGKKIIFIDSCHSESVSNTRSVSTDNTALLRQLREPSTIVFTSCTSNQLAHEYDAQQHGVFTYAILDGLRGAAASSDGAVNMKALDAHVSDTVSKMTHGAQNPVSTIKDGNYTDFVISLTR